MATQGDVKPLGQYVVERVSTNTTVPRTFSVNASGYFDFPIASTGKTPVGIVGVLGSGTSAFAFEDVYIDSETLARVYVRNVATVAATINNMKVDVLYRID